MTGDLHLSVVILLFIFHLTLELQVKEPYYEEIFSPSIRLDDQDFVFPPTNVIAADPLNACHTIKNNLTNVIAFIDGTL
jgi:hypothetical protein